MSTFTVPSAALDRRIAATIDAGVRNLLWGLTARRGIMRVDNKIRIRVRRPADDRIYARVVARVHARISGEGGR